MRQIPFDIKYKMQIVCRDYSVITSYGNYARIICWDRNNDYPIFQAIPDKAEIVLGTATFPRQCKPLKIEDLTYIRQLEGFARKNPINIYASPKDDYNYTDPIFGNYLIINIE